MFRTELICAPFVSVLPTVFAKFGIPSLSTHRPRSNQTTAYKVRCDDANLNPVRSRTDPKDRSDTDRKDPSRE